MSGAIKPVNKGECIGFQLLNKHDETKFRNEGKTEINERINKIESGIANRRITAYCVVVFNWHDTLGFSSKTDFIEHHFPMSRQEVYKEKSRAEYELILFNGDIDKVGVIRAAHLDYLRYRACKSFESFEDIKAFLLGVWARVEETLNLESRLHEDSERYSLLSVNQLRHMVESYLIDDSNMRTKADTCNNSDCKSSKDESEATDLLDESEENETDSNVDNTPAEKQAYLPNEQPCSDEPENNKSTESPQNQGEFDVWKLFEASSSAELNRDERNQLYKWLDTWFINEHKRKIVEVFMEGLLRTDEFDIHSVLMQHSRVMGLEKHVNALQLNIKYSLGIEKKAKAA
ncbi:MAG: hypothetical protein CL591_05335 [Alteromonas sp.]|nr:hypothetical protein [Alteromonas sp.]|tara:strand:- start:2058 stop:3095 length:1038 start_codon:yes stop_codon:yes gene_type:complete